MPHPTAATPALDVRFDSELREAVCEWLRANGIDPALVPGDEKPDCSYRPDAGTPAGGHTITTRVHLKVAPAGQGKIVRHGSNRLEEATVTRPMKVPPPPAVVAWLDATCPTCGR